jgi:spore maturation protein CgeB
MKIVVYGLTLTSSWGNGHATTYRSLLKALARLGHTVDFVEKNVEWYASNRDLPGPAYCRVHLYDDWWKEEKRLVAQAADADVVVIGSYFPDAIAATHAILAATPIPVLFYDIDTPVTLAALRAHGKTTYLDAEHIPQYAAYLSFTGGPALLELAQRFGAKRAIPFYCSVDPDAYFPEPTREPFRSDLSYLGTYAPDRQPKLMHLLDQTAAILPGRRFIVAGSLYPSNFAWQPNVTRLIHLPPQEHSAFYSSSRFTLNLTRGDMVAAGYSPSVRLFEASACRSTILSDRWAGLEDFLTPGLEILTPTSSEDVAQLLIHLSDRERSCIGKRAQERILSEHTSHHRALQFETIVSGCQGAQIPACAEMQA